MAKQKQPPAEYPYLSDSKAPLQLLGLAPLMNPFTDHVSAQRLMMLSQHLVQYQLLNGCEFPQVFTGFETFLGDYEHDTTERDQGIQVEAVIPRFQTGVGLYPLKDNPYYTIVYRGDDGKIGYFNLNKYTYRSDGYGYQNKWINNNRIHVGNYNPKDVKLCTSPAHEGFMYKYGTNLNMAYMAIPHVTEDAFVISKSAAKKLGSTAFGKISIKILPTQVPIDLYGTEDEYKFIPDIGEKIGDDGILCALRTPSENSILFDMQPENLKKVQFLHDSIFYAPAGAEIVDVNIVVNRNCRIRTNCGGNDIFSQVQKYRDPINAYNLKVVEAYQNAVSEGREITPAFNTLVTRCMQSLLIDGVRNPNFPHRVNLTATKRKDAIEFLYITITYKYDNPVTRGIKLTGTNGNKGTVCVIMDDEDMPVDDFGIRADVVVAAISVFNRMNPSQWYLQFVTRTAEMVRRKMESIVKVNPTENSYLEAYSLMLDFLNDCNPHWAEKVNNDHPQIQDKIELVKESIADKIYINIPPFTKGIDQNWVIKMRDKYNVVKTPVEFNLTMPDGTKQHIRTKKPVMIGSEYIIKLYKQPHQRVSGIGYVNQYRSPIRPSALAKAQYPFSLTPIRLGEDEIRNIVMTSGAEVAAHILGVYANSQDAVYNLGRHLLFDKEPSKLAKVDLAIKDIIKSNSIIEVTRHIFSSFGVNIAPQQEDIQEILNDKDAASATEEADDLES